MTDDDAVAREAAGPARSDDLPGHDLHADGVPADDDDDERLRREVPPHHGD